MATHDWSNWATIRACDDITIAQVGIVDEGLYWIDESHGGEHCQVLGEVDMVKRTSRGTDAV